MLKPVIFLAPGTTCKAARFGSELIGNGGVSASLRRSMIEQQPMKRSRTKSPSLDEARLRQQAIGVRLRQMFDEVVNEPVPDEFLQILRRADAERPGEN
jgi:hypothetical protein